jgi:chromosome segregation ATPase
MLAAMEARLGAEQMGLDTLGFPSDLLADRDASHVAAAIAGQTQEFAARDAALEGERSLLERRIAQLREEIDGAEAQAASYQAQMRSVLDEKSALEDLADRQLVPRTRLLQLERSAMQLQGQVGEAMARSAKAEETIRELNGQIAQLHKDRAEQIARDLRDTRLKLIELRSRLHANQRALAELEVRAP